MPDSQQIDRIRSSISHDKVFVLYNLGVLAPGQAAMPCAHLTIVDDDGEPVALLLMDYDELIRLRDNIIDMVMILRKAQM